MPRLVPKLVCFDLAAGVEFCRLLGFQVAYGRPMSGFPYLERREAEFVLEQSLTKDRLYPQVWNGPERAAMTPENGSGGHRD
ncbi:MULTISPECIES: hypothetical protein [Actinomadura]|uniref:Uncharacterized protein n=1 Tax=Actinomadura yumaensis TaxID=111807 RepID=A0ABW2CJR2_9ACTN|nr:hypothetical protein [Actinomadura sp. J1-007]MWK37135.1 hypothetical protein [Actinomadura sp. J1-007]